MNLREIDLKSFQREITAEERIAYAAIPREQAFSLPDYEKLRYFASTRVFHKLLEEAERKMTKAFLNPTKRIIPIIGASGSGKSAFCEDVLAPMFKSEVFGEIPYLYVNLAAYGRNKPEFSTALGQALAAAGEIMVAEKFAAYLKDGSLVASRFSRDAKRQALVSAINTRKTKVLVFDEFVHLLRGVRAEDFALLDAVKSIANDMKHGVFLVVGGPDLYSPLAQYMQAIRREDTVYIGRYTTEEEAAAKKRIRAEGKQNQEIYPPFETIVRKLMSRWPCRVRPPFDAIIDQLLDATLGLVGLLMPLLLACLIEQLSHGERWDPNFFIRSVPSAGEMKRMRAEVEAGERLMQSEGWGVQFFNEEQRMEIREKLTILPPESTEKSDEKTRD